MNVLDWFFEFAISLKAKDPNKKSILISHIFVPFIVILFWGMMAGLPGFHNSISGNVQIIEFLTSKNDKNEIDQRFGSLFLFESLPGDFFIPTETNLDQIMLSLPKEIAEANKAKIMVDKKAVRVITPFLGRNDPIAIYVDGKTKSEFYAINKKISNKSVKYTSQKGFLIALSCFCVFIFTLGISIGSLNLSENKYSPEKTSNHR